MYRTFDLSRISPDVCSTNVLHSPQSGHFPRAYVGDKRCEHHKIMTTYPEEYSPRPTASSLRRWSTSGVARPSSLPPDAGRTRQGVGGRGGRRDRRDDSRTLLPPNDDFTLPQTAQKEGPGRLPRPFCSLLSFPYSDSTLTTSLGWVTLMLTMVSPSAIS